MESHPNSNDIDEKAIADARELSEKMLRIAEKGIVACTDDACLQVYGIIRDCGYKIRRIVEQEQHCFV